MIDLDTTTLDLTQDMIDSREIKERIETLEDLENLTDDEREELVELKRINTEGENVAADWHYGEQLIRGTYFVEYVQELCADIGGVPLDIPCYIEIDWDATAENIKMDYSEIEINGMIYYIR